MREDDLPGQFGELLRHGRIASVDLPAGLITVQLGDIETQPIRFFTGGQGGTRLWSRPKPGEQVTLLTPGGDIEAAIAMRGHFCDDFPPIGDEDRELVRFEDGAEIAYDPQAHHLQIMLPPEGAITIEAAAGITIKGDVTVEGDVIANGVSLIGHVHGESMPGDGETGQPVAEA